MRAGGSDAPLGRVEVGASAPDVRAPSATGPFRLSGLRGRPVVLEWTSPVCPYTARKYEAGAMQAVQRQAARRGVAWVSVDTAAPGRPGALTPAAARARVARTGATVAAFVLDADGSVGRLYGVRVTPTVFLIGRDGRLAYQGAVDDDAWSSGPQSLGFLRDALDDLLAGRPQRRAETRPYGCPVEY